MKTKNLYLFILSMSLIIYFLLNIVIYYVIISKGGNGVSFNLFGGGNDGDFYYQQALNVAHGLSYVHSSIHVVLFGWLLKIFNTENVIVLRIFNFAGIALLFSISLAFLKKISFDKNLYFYSANLFMIILICYPSLLINSTISIFRDIWIYFYYLACLYFFSSLLLIKPKYPKILYFTGLIVSMYMLYNYRKYALLSFILGALIYFFFNFAMKRNVNIKNILILIFIIFGVVFTFFRNLNIPIVNMSLYEALNYRELGLNEYAGGSQLNISLDQSNIFLFYLNYFYSLISNIFGPFFWQISGVSTALIMVTEGLLFIYVVIYLYKNRKKFGHLEKFIIIQSIIWFMLISISNDNLGTATRLRSVGWIPLLIIFVKIYTENKFIKKSANIFNERLEVK